MTRDELKRMFPKMSEDALNLNATDALWEPKAKPRRSLKEIVLAQELQNGTPKTCHPLPSPEPKQAVLNVSIEPSRGKAAYTGRVTIRIESFRKRLIDPDNLCPKYMVDGLRYANIISGDSAAEVEIVTTQTRVSSKEEERTEITITPIR